MTIGVTNGTNSPLMAALRDRIDSGSAPGYIEFYDGARPAHGAAPAGELVSTVVLADPCGTIDGGNGDLLLSPSVVGQVLVASMPTWGRVYASGGAIVLDCKCRSSSVADDPDDPAELVIYAPSLSVGAFLLLTSGSFTLRPAA